jgi:hypothetical protein
MARPSDRLGTKQVEKLVKAGNRGMWNDGRGLYLKVNGPNSASWIFRYAAGGSPKDMGLGSVADVPLAKARELRDAQRRLRVDGIDPIGHRRVQRAARLVADAKAMTFAQCAAAYVASHTIRVSGNRRIAGRGDRHRVGHAGDRANLENSS